MRDPYAHFNEMFHLTGIPEPIKDPGPVDSSRPNRGTRAQRVRRARVRSFEIACTMAAAELSGKAVM